jgi:hypothetical protein
MIRTTLTVAPRKPLNLNFSPLGCFSEVDSLVWGVFSRDCYGIPKEEIENYLLKTFEDYGEALIFAQSLGKKSAIHWTYKRKQDSSQVKENSETGHNG